MYRSGLWLFDSNGDNMLMLKRGVTWLTEEDALGAAKSEAVAMNISEGTTALPVAFLVTGSLFISLELFRV